MGAATNQEIIIIHKAILRPRDIAMLSHVCVSDIRSVYNEIRQQHTPAKNTENVEQLYYTE
jgi:hypothetical protein